MKPHVFILSYERPMYLWATLDALYRNTLTNAHFVLLDNASKDPGVRQVVEGFVRRGMLAEVEWGDTNDPQRLEKAIDARRSELGERFFFVENDVVVSSEVCWIEAYDRVADQEREAGRSAGVVGSFCDPADFPDVNHVKALYPNASDKDINFLAKSNSPERGFEIPDTMDIWPDPNQHPPGRLIRVDCKAYDKVGFCGDALFGRRLREAGYTTKVCTRFRHRHLSLMNAYDLDDADYAEKRRSFFSGLDRRSGSARLSSLIRRVLNRMGWR